MLQGLFGNASEIDAKGLQRDLDAILAEGEQVVKAFRIVRDLFVFTDKRLILIDKQGVTGKKAEYHSIPFHTNRSAIFRWRQPVRLIWMPR